MKKLLSIVLASAMLMTVFAGCGNEPAPAPESEAPAEGSESTAAPVEGESNPNKPDTLIIRGVGDPMSFNPDLAGDDNLYAPAQNMFHRLTCLDASKSPIPDAAESWDISDDALKITWHLKQNLKWHDGEQLDAEDVKYTFDYIKANPTCYFSSSMSIVDEINIIDPFTVEFVLNQADMSFIARIGWYGTFILPEHIFNNGQPWDENPATRQPIGSNAYKFDSYVQGSTITLVANEEYAEGAPKIKTLVFANIPDDATAMQALQNGEVDFCEMIPAPYVPQFQADPNFKLSLDKYPSPYRILFNVTSEKLSDLAVRKAIALCIDRKEVSDKAYGSIMPPEFSVYPSVVEWCSNTEDTYPEFNIDEAIKTLEDAGYTKDADGYYVRGIEWEVFEGMQDMANLIIANCKKAGIELILNLSEYNAWDAKVNTDGNFMMESQGGFMGPDPAMLYTCLGTEQGRNYALWSNAEFDELCLKAAAEPDKEKRAELYKAAQKLVVDELPLVNVVGFAAYQGMRSDLHDMPVDGTGKWGWANYSHAYFE